MRDVVVMAEAVRAADARKLLWPPVAAHTVPAVARGDRGSWGSWGTAAAQGKRGWGRREAEPSAAPQLVASSSEE